VHCRSKLRLGGWGMTIPSFHAIPLGNWISPSSSVPSVQDLGRNFLLAELSPEALSLIHKYLREQDFDEGSVIWHAGLPAGQVFFPVSGMISIAVPTKDGHGIEVAVIGREGAAGLDDRSGMLPMVTQAVAQAPGRFISIAAQAFAAAERESEEIGHMAAACRRWLLLQSQQIAVCNAVHSAEARFCRWLLRASDALEAETVPVTQEMIAQALGIRRTTATLIAQQLQLRGTISYSRGKIALRDRAGLQAAACDCHHAFGRAHWPSELLRASGVADDQSATG
jgi:CRP-like cAMP-binding protein